MLEQQEILVQIVTDRGMIAVVQDFDGVVGQVLLEPLDQFWVFMEH